MTITTQVGEARIDNHFIDNIGEMAHIFSPRHIVLVTDAHIASLYPTVVDNYPSLIIPAGEDQKSLAVIEGLLQRLLDLGANRKTMLLGLGGGVITDIAGFLGSIFMRGIDVSLVPTSLLAMVDAAIGGKNGVNIGLNKNIAGTFTQPRHIIFHTSFLETLPSFEWENGFAEMVKYGCIGDKQLFQTLSQGNIATFRSNTAAMATVIQRCAQMKYETVINDEKEQGARKLLNFGHTAGHALETVCHLSHGRAVALGMCIAAKLSEQLLGFQQADSERLRQTLTQYNLPTSIKAPVKEVMQVLKNDKKRTSEHIEYVLLNTIGDAIVKPVHADAIEHILTSCLQ